MEIRSMKKTELIFSKETTEKLTDLDDQLAELEELLIDDEITKEELLKKFEQITQELIQIGEIMPGAEESVTGFKDGLQEMKTLLGKKLQ